MILGCRLSARRGVSLFVRLGWPQEMSVVDKDVSTWNSQTPAERVSFLLSF